MIQKTAYVLLGMMLVYCSGTDIKRKMVSSIALVGFALIGIAFYAIFHLIGIKSMIGGSLIGFIIMGISKLTKGGIGLGDGGLLCVMGLYVGFYKNLEIFLLALLMASICGIVLLLIKKADRKTELPFVPFLTIAYIIVVTL